jgi:hypothetical protein
MERKLEPFARHGTEDRRIEVLADDILNAIVEERDVDIEYAHIKGNLYISDVSERLEPSEEGKLVIGASIGIRECEIHGTISLGHVTFRRDVSFRSTTFNRHAYFMSSVFEGNADFGNTSFDGDADFSAANFRGDVDFAGARFRDEVKLRSVTFSERADFTGVDIQRVANFSSRSRILWQQFLTWLEGYVPQLASIFRKHRYMLAVAIVAVLLAIAVVSLVGYLVLKLIFLILGGIWRGLRSLPIWRAVIGFWIVAAVVGIVYAIVRTLARLAILILMIIGTYLALESSRTWGDLIVMCIIAGLFVGIATIPLIPYLKD